MNIFQFLTNTPLRSGGAQVDPPQNQKLPKIKDPYSLYHKEYLCQFSAQSLKFYYVYHTASQPFNLTQKSPYVICNNVYKVLYN